MLTFLRKIRKSFIESGSTRKYIIYAIGEIALVVIGILIALQINNWNQKRLNSITEKVVLKEINKEFKYNKKELESTIRAYNRLRDICSDLKKSFPIDPQKIDNDSLANVLRRLRGLASADLSMGSISTLSNTSSFDIISNDDLRSLLIQWEDLISDYFEREEQAINYVRQFVVPYLAKRLPQPYDLGLNDKRVDLSFLSSIEFENLIDDRIRDANTMLNVVKDKDSEIIMALERIIELSSDPEN